MEKFTGVAFSVLVVVMHADLLADMAYIKTCNENSPISLETMNRVLIHKQLDENESSNFKCFLQSTGGWMKTVDSLYTKLRRCWMRHNWKLPVWSMCCLSVPPLIQWTNGKDRFYLPNVSGIKLFRNTLDDQFLYHLEDKK